MTILSISEASVTPPTPALAGDRIEIVGNEVRIIRGGEIIATANLGPEIPIQSGDVTTTRIIASLFFAKVKLMPGQNVSCTGVTENNTTGAVTFKFSNGDQDEYANWAACGDVADEMDAQPDFPKKVLIAKAFRSSPDGANKTNQVGAQVSINALADSPVVYTEPQ